VKSCKANSGVNLNGEYRRDLKDLIGFRKLFLRRRLVTSESRKKRSCKMYKHPHCAHG
jgi:hypothetical protein